MTQTTVLIVEDEAIVAADLAGKLGQLGYEVVGVVAQGEEAVAAARRCRPSVVLMDIWLKGTMDGIQAAEAIRSQCDVPVIYLTAHSDAATLARAKVTEPFGYILKPYEDRELATHIEMALYKHQVDRQLREQREWLRVTLTSIGDAVIACDAAGRVTFLNPVAESLTGWKAEEALGQPMQTVFRIINEQTCQPIEDPVARVLREHRVVELANHSAVLTKDGRTVPIEDSAAPILDSAGRLVGVVLVFHDVTDKRRAEQALRENREDLNRAQAVAHTGSWRLDVRRNELVWSDETHRIFGVPHGTPLTYETFLSAIHPEDRQIVDDHWQAALRGQGYDVEHRIVVGGEVKWVREKAELEFDEKGPLCGGFGTVQDITDRKRMEQALVEAKIAAEAANEAKGRFLANVSHELRTPMNAILGMVDLALPRQTDPTAKEFLDTARNSADLLLALLNDLLDSAKMEAGKLQLEAVPFSLRRVLDQTTQVLTVRASEKGICFACRVPADVPDALIGDQVRLRQVLLNLAGNAVKFTERGEVVVGVEVDEADTRRRGDAERGVGKPEDPPRLRASACPSPTVTLRFAISDTGIGIPPDEIERIFHPFTQADASTTRRYGGTGLGLNICSGLVGMMGGRIWVESQAGQGSVFYFTVRLPLAKEVPPEPETSAGPAAAPMPLQVLLVEDNPANQKLAAYILRERGHRVDIAGSGDEGLRMALAGKYDIILMDVQMPDMDGLEATKAIRKREEETALVLGLGSSDPTPADEAPNAKPQDLRPSRRVPIIAMTAHAMQGDRDRCLAGGMDGYLSKPINGREMIALVETLAAGSDAAEHPSARRDAACATSRVFDLKQALNQCCDNPAMFLEMTQCFFEEVAFLLPQLRSALEANDFIELGRIAHRLKGTVVYLGAEAATAAAMRLEQFARCGGTRAEADDAVIALEREIEALKAALAGHRAAISPREA